MAANVLLLLVLVRNGNGIVLNKPRTVELLYLGVQEFFEVGKDRNWIVQKFGLTFQVSSFRPMVHYLIDEPTLNLAPPLSPGEGKGCAHRGVSEGGGEAYL